MSTLEKCIDRLTNRHIAKLMRRVSHSIKPNVEANIKRQFWFFADDVKDQVREISEQEKSIQN